jgi:hypothetical protein
MALLCDVSNIPERVIRVRFGKAKSLNQRPMIHSYRSLQSEMPKKEQAKRIGVGGQSRAAHFALRGPI